MAKHLRISALFFHSLFILPLAQANQWDWVPRESLNSEQQSQLNQYCHGSYIDGWRATNTSGTDLIADNIVRDEKGRIHLTGQARITQPTSMLSADSIEGVPSLYYKAEGNVSLRKKGQLIRSSSAYVSNTNTSPTEFIDAKFISHQTGARGEAKSLLQDKNGIVFIQEGFFTTCEPDNDSWKLYGSAIELNTTSGFGTAKHVQIRLADIPIFYIPWLRFPIDNRRQTGLLFPSFGYSSKDGLSLSAPFYWNIATNYDATITPQLIQNKGEGIDLEFRHLSPYGETIYEQSSFFDDKEDEQTVLKLTSAQTLNRYFSAGLLLEDNPTKDKYPEANSTSIGEKDNYERRVYLDFNNGNFNNKITYRTYYTPDDSLDKPFEWLPRIDSSYRFATHYLDYALTAQYTDFYDPDENNFDGQRTILNQDIQLSFSNAWGSFTPGVIAQYRDYNLHSYNTDSDSTTSLDHVSGYLDSNIVFERNVLMSNHDQWRQTLEPRLSYLNAPFEDQSLIPIFDASLPTMTYSQAFSHQRFSGNDRIGDTEQVTLGLESRLYDANNNERWTFKAGTLFYLTDRYVGISGTTNQNTPVEKTKHSDLLTSASYNGGRYSLTSNLNYNQDNNEISLAQLTSQMEPVNDVKVNLSYLYTINNTDSDNNAKQASIGTIFPISQNWSIFSQYTYDFLIQDSIREVAGLGYENCCIKVSLSYQDWLNDDSKFDRGVFFQFILRSLSTAGRANTEASIADDYWNQGKIGY